MGGATHALRQREIAGKQQELNNVLVFRIFAGKQQELNNVLELRIWVDLPATHALRQTEIAGKQQELNGSIFRIWVELRMLCVKQSWPVNFRN